MTHVTDNRIPEMIAYFGGFSIGNLSISVEKSKQLEEVGGETKNVAVLTKANAASALNKIFNTYKISDVEAPIFQEEYVLEAINQLERIDGGVYGLSALGAYEAKMHAEIKGRVLSGEKLEVCQTHQHEIIEAIVALGGEDAVNALTQFMCSYYPDEVLDGLKHIDAPNTAKAIQNLTQVDFRNGIHPRNIKGLCYLAELREKFDSGEFEKATPASIRNAVDDMCAVILDREDLMNCLNGGRKYVRGQEVEYLHRPADKPMSDEILNELYVALLSIDDTNISNTKYAAKLDNIVIEHDRRVAANAVLDAEFGASCPEAM